MRKKIGDLTGKRFGRLTVVGRSEGKGHSSVLWVCACDCGNTVIVDWSRLNSGHTKSCGCYRNELTSKRKPGQKHGMSGTRIYRIWAGMKSRCDDECKSKYYKDKGISVCKEWETFEPFYEWAVSNGYADNLTIDRIDNSGNYCPENCRWATPKEQARNRTNNRIVEVNGKSMPLSEASEITGIPRYLFPVDKVGKRK